MEAALRDYCNSFNSLQSSSPSDYSPLSSIWGGGWREAEERSSVQLTAPQSGLRVTCALCCRCSWLDTCLDCLDCTHTRSDWRRCCGCRGYAALWEHTLGIHSVCHADHMVVFIPRSSEHRREMQVLLLFLWVCVCVWLRIFSRWTLRRTNVWDGAQLVFFFLFYL